MKLLIVISDYHNKSNGMSISTQRFVEAFKKVGAEVRVLSSCAGGTSDYTVPTVEIPIFQPIIDEQGFHFAKAELDIISEAVDWADYVHVEEPFGLCSKAAKYAKAAGKPVSGTFHLYPENMAEAIRILNHKLGREGLMRFFIKHVYQYCDCIQCPTIKVKQRLEKYKLPARLFVTTNGVTEEFVREAYNYDATKQHNENVFTILSIGRFAPEKDQMTLVRAIKLSKHRDDIQLVLAGQGPNLKKIKRATRDFAHQPIIHFFERAELTEVMHQSDLYVHCAYVEIEGMSCMEAFSMGLVPIIADSELSSTILYALSEKNAFPSKDEQALADCIDYWIEHPVERAEMSDKYKEFAHTITVEASARNVIKEIS